MSTGVEIEVNERGMGKVIIDGVDMSNRVSRVEFEAIARDFTTVRLTLAPCVVKVKATVYEVETEQPEIELAEG